MGVKRGTLKKIIAAIAIGLIIVGCTACGAKPEKKAVSHESAVETLNENNEYGEWKYDSERSAYILYETEADNHYSKRIKEYYKTGSVTGWEIVRDSYEDLAATLAQTTDEDCYLIIADPSNHDYCIFVADKDGVKFDMFTGYKRGE